MKMIHTFLITFLVGVFFGLPGSVDAWNSQKQYDQYGSSHTYDKGKRHHQRYDHSYPNPTLHIKVVHLTEHVSQEYSAPL